MYTNAVLFGAFDLFHKGHKNFCSQVLLTAKKGSVFVLPDVLIQKYKGVKPHDPERTRLLNVYNSLKGNFAVYLHTGDEEVNLKMAQNLTPDAILLGEDQTNSWVKKVIALNPQASVVYLKRTPGISSTQLRGQAK
jgi:cytidyltransferase-like protein